MCARRRIVAVVMLLSMGATPPIAVAEDVTVSQLARQLEILQRQLSELQSY